MKKLLMIVMVTMASVGAFGYTSASYVQDGLIAQWDGINNVGTGVHDPAATVWKDLAGSYDLSLLPGGRWSGDGMSLSVNGAGAKLRLALPIGAFDANKAIVTVSGGIAADATAGLVIDDVEAFCVTHSRGRVTLLSCGTDSTAALRNLAARVNATPLPRGKLSVVGGTSLVFKAPVATLISV